MNFASWTFLLLFLPVVLMVFHAIRGRDADAWRAIAMIAASVVFYLWAGLYNAAVMSVSLAVTYAAGRTVSALTKDRERLRRILMWAGVAANVALLAAFKVSALAASDGGFRTLESVLIPLGLSYVTFQQIGFIVACRRGQIVSPSLRDYLFFITFFPHLLLGPIVRFQDMARQLAAQSLTRVSASDVGAGLSIFVFGLAQKVLLADQIAPAVDRIFLAAQTGPISPLESWFGVVAFQMQLYFDFVAYADMAIGLARMFGIRLPINFDRPLFAVDRFDLCGAGTSPSPSSCAAMSSSRSSGTGGCRSRRHWRSPDSYPAFGTDSAGRLWSGACCRRPCSWWCTSDVEGCGKPGLPPDLSGFPSC